MAKAKKIMKEDETFRKTMLRHVEWANRTALKGNILLEY